MEWARRGKRITGRSGRRPGESEDGRRRRDRGQCNGLYPGGGGDSGAVEECACLDAAGAAIACPDITLQGGEADKADGAGSKEAQTLGEALEQLTYLALERHHPGWEINDGACGELVIDVAEATFVLDCSLRFTATDDHSTEL